MPLLLLGGALAAAWFLFGGGETQTASGSGTTPRPAPELPPTAVGTVGLTAPNGVALVAPLTPSDFAHLIALVGPLPASVKGKGDVLLVADAQGSFVAALLGTPTPTGFNVRDLRLLKGSTLAGILQNRPIRDAVLGWEDAGTLVFYDKNGHRVSLRALFGR
jgi:hypothetical protein